MVLNGSNPKGVQLCGKCACGSDTCKRLTLFHALFGVANILLDLEVPPNVIAAGLLHDVLMDTQTTVEQLRKEFGKTITGFVEDVTRITALPNFPEQTSILQSGHP